MEKQYTLKEASELLNIKVRTLRVLINNKTITAKKYKNLNVLYIAESEIERYQKEMNNAVLQKKDLC